MNSILRTEKLTRVLPGEVPVTLVQDIDLTIG
ncbi:MAG: ABC transporter ATP-binding protein, partial [Gammaproteobacteria bacterium]|nr:ABC transporter ATP-binding protein [Gammaproteobacteria bacterium]